MAARPLVIIHGWSDTPDGMAPLATMLEQELGRKPVEVRLAKWISMDDQVTYADVIEAMTRAWTGAGLPTSPRSADVVVHSTGGLVVRHWLAENYDPLSAPIKNLLMIAPANFGSPLAHKGQAFIGRIVKGWNSEKMFQTGTLILKGLELASPYSWNLAERDRFRPTSFYGPDRILCTVLVGNAGYTGIAAAMSENGTDGTVRVSTANLNCAYLEADFSKDPHNPRHRLSPSIGTVAFGVLNDENHATIVGKHGGPKNPATQGCFGQALKVDDDTFGEWVNTLANRTADVMRANASDEYRHGYQNTVVRVVDDTGEEVRDYFLEFYVDSDPDDEFAQMFHQEALDTTHAYGDNHAYRSLHVNCTKLLAHLAAHEEIRGIKISLTAVPDFTVNGHVGYRTFSDKEIGGIALDRKAIEGLFQPNRTLLVKMMLRREQAADVFTLQSAT